MLCNYSVKYKGDIRALSNVTVVFFEDDYVFSGGAFFVLNLYYVHFFNDLFFALLFQNNVFNHTHVLFNIAVSWLVGHFRMFATSCVTKANTVNKEIINHTKFQVLNHLKNGYSTAVTVLCNTPIVNNQNKQETAKKEEIIQDLVISRFINHAINHTFNPFRCKAVLIGMVVTNDNYVFCAR